MSPLLIFHITTASIALLGGVAAMSLRKGSTAHRTGGTVFVIGMICMTASAIPLGRRVFHRSRSRWYHG